VPNASSRGFSRGAESRTISRRRRCAGSDLRAGAKHHERDFGRDPRHRHHRRRHEPARHLSASDEDDKAGREIARLNREYDQMTRALPATGVGGAAMRDAVSFYTTYIQGYPSLTGFLVPLSGVLQEHPRVRLSQLAWQATDNPARRRRSLPSRRARPRR
jgi:hypothetical protein